MGGLLASFGVGHKAGKAQRKQNKSIDAESPSAQTERLTGIRASEGERRRRRRPRPEVISSVKDGYRRHLG